MLILTSSGNMPLEFCECGGGDSGTNASPSLKPRLVLATTGHPRRCQSTRPLATRGIQPITSLSSLAHHRRARYKIWFAFHGVLINASARLGMGRFAVSCPPSGPLSGPRPVPKPPSQTHRSEPCLTMAKGRDPEYLANPLDLPRLPRR